MGSVLIYQTKRRIWLTLEGGYARLNRNMAMHDPDFLAFKGHQTDIEFIVRDIDRKPINLTDRDCFITLVNFKNGEVIANIPLNVIDATRGIIRLELNPRVIQDIPLGFHQYTVSYKLPNGNTKLLNIDQYETARGFFEVKLGSHPEYVGTQVFTFDEFTTDTYDAHHSIHISPNFKGNLQRGSTFGLHTLAIYLENYTGSIWVEGSITLEAPSYEDWFPIEIDQKIETKYQNISGIQAYNIESNLSWVRIRTLQTVLNPGKIIKVVFRN